MNKNAILIIVILIAVILLVVFWNSYAPWVSSIFGKIFRGGGENNGSGGQSILDKIEAAILMKLRNN